MNCNWKTTASGISISPLNSIRSPASSVTTAPKALATVNGVPVQNTVLRNGDAITAGSVNIQFWLAAARQSSLRLRENFVWFLLALVTLGQFTLLYWLIR